MIFVINGFFVFLLRILFFFFLVESFSLKFAIFPHGILILSIEFLLPYATVHQFQTLNRLLDAPFFLSSHVGLILECSQKIDGTDYRGSLNKTASGVMCKNWVDVKKGKGCYRVFPTKQDQKKVISLFLLVIQKIFKNNFCITTSKSFLLIMSHDY